MFDPKTVQPRKQDSEAVRALLSVGMHPVIARVLANRGVETPASAALLLRDLEPPHNLRDLDKAAEIVAQAILSKISVCIVGDYDADGPVGHFKIPHLWSPKIPQAGRVDYQLTEGFCANRVAASLSR